MSVRTAVERAWQMGTGLFALLFLMLTIAAGVLWKTGVLSRERVSLMVRVLEGKINEPVPPTEKDLRDRYDALVARERQAESQERLRIEEANRMALLVARDRDALTTERVSQKVVEASFDKERDAFVKERQGTVDGEKTAGIAALKKRLQAMEPADIEKILIQLDDDTLAGLMKSFRPDLVAELLPLLAQDLAASARPVGASPSRFDRLLEALKRQ